MRKKLITAFCLPILLLAAGCQIGRAAAEGTTSERPATATQATTRPSAATSAPAAGTAPSSRPGTPQPAAPNTKPSLQMPDAALTLIASGDVLSHAGTLKAARQDDGRYDYLPMFAPIQDLLSDGDYTLVNMETAVAGEEFGYRGFPRFNAPVALAQALKQSGVDMAVTANNHAMDSGLEGLRANLDNLERVGLEPLGTYRSKEEAEQAKIVDINGIRVGFIATTNKVTMEFADDFSVDRNKPATIRKRIAQARKEGAELIVFHIHWGKEYTDYPTQVQMDLYQILEEEGVDIVIGSHPHRLQPIELREITYKGRRKTQAVIWSTANLLWGQTSSKENVYTGSVFKIRAERKNGRVTVQSLDYDLVYNLMWTDAAGKRQLRIVPEADKEMYRKSFPRQYEHMVREFEWAHKALARPVDLVYTEGSRPKD